MSIQLGLLDIVDLPLEIVSTHVIINIKLVSREQRVLVELIFMSFRKLSS